MNKKLALRTFIAACIGVLGGIAPLAVTGNFAASTTRAVAEVAAATHTAHFTEAKVDVGSAASAIAVKLPIKLR